MIRAMLIGAPLVAALVLVGEAHSQTQARSQAFDVVGYLPDYRFAEFDLTKSIGVTDLVLFSAELSPSGDLDTARLKGAPWAKIRQFKTQRSIRLILAIGGWERSANFAAVCHSKEGRKRMIDSVIKTCLRERLDGIDLDWEHPQSKEEEEDYATLMEDLRRAFEPHGLLLSVTMAGWQGLPERGFAAVDRVHLMSYDHPGEHSTLEDAKNEVNALISAGARAEKIVLGMPFYGRDKANPQRSMTYREILEKYHPGKETNEVDGLYFNGPDLVAKKTRYALEQKLRGVMFWELGQDADGADSLLSVIREEVSRK